MPLVEKRYAEAMVQLALQTGEIDSIQKDLQSVVSHFIKIPELKALLLNPQVRTDVKKDFLKSIFGTGIKPEVLSFLMLLLDKGRVKNLSGILDEFIKSADKKRRMLNIKITSAVALESSQIAKIRDKYIVLYNATGAKVVTEIDESLIGGIKVVIGDKVIDGSIKGKLEDLNKLVTGY